MRLHQFGDRLLKFLQSLVVPFQRLLEPLLCLYKLGNRLRQAEHLARQNSGAQLVTPLGVLVNQTQKVSDIFNLKCQSRSPHPHYILSAL